VPPAAAVAPARAATETTAALTAALPGSPADADVRRAALGASGGGNLAGVQPSSVAGETTHAPRLDTVLTASDEDGLAAHERLGHTGAAPLEDAPDGLAGDAHDLGGLFVAQSLEVDEADGLELVDAELQLLELARRYARGLEQRDARHAGDGAFNRRSRHGPPL
jgi:hypothetical protein